MENKKNNATEKVENITNETSNEKSEQKAQNSKTAQKNAEKKAENQRTKNAVQKKNDKKAKKSAKTEKQSAREKKKELRKELNKKKREEWKRERLRRKEERLARRDMLKKESKKDREKRLQAEKQAKLKERLAKREEKIKRLEEKNALRRQKLADRRMLREQKMREKNEQKRERSRKGLGGWITAVSILGATTLALATLFTLSLTTPLGSSDDVSMVGGVDEAFYEFVDMVNDMDVNLSKLVVSTDEKSQQKILSDLVVSSTLAEVAVSRLPLKDESRYYTMKYVNQVGDFSKYLNNKLIDGDNLNKDDKENLSSLYKITNTLKNEINLAVDSMGEDFNFATMLDENSDNVVLKAFNNLESNAIDYPTLIYDGPFSDGLQTKEVKNLKGEEINLVEARAIFEKAFQDYNVKEIEELGELNSRINTYNFEAKSNDTILFAEISKKGGKVISFNTFADCYNKNYSLEDCIEIGYDMIESLGVSGMTAVWATESGATAYINYAYETKDAICYPDMIKVAVCMERGVVSNFDAREYYFNHQERKIEAPTLTKEQAVAKINKDIQVDTVRLAIVPKGTEKEVLTYEIAGVYEDNQYFVYVDAKTGREVNIFKVVENTEGKLIV